MGNIISKTDIVVQLVVLGLVGMSIFVWSLFFTKTAQLRRCVNKMDAFEKKFWSGIMLEEFYSKNSTRLGHHMGRVFVSGMEEWVASQQTQNLSDPYTKDALRDRLMVVMSQSVDKIDAELSAESETVSTIASVAPFLGLFGTVWGIMDTFKAIAGSLTVTLNTIAPGVAEALVTTGIGIFVAICAVVIHQSISGKVAKCVERLNSFKTDMFAILSRELDYIPSDQIDSAVADTAS